MSKTAKTQSSPVEIPVRITLVGPPAGVDFRLQQGRSKLMTPARATDTEIQFNFALRLGPPRAGRPNFLGAAAQGPPAGRFVYINAGRQAGQQGAFWDRRAKVPLHGISEKLVRAVLAAPGTVLEARIAGTAKDGGPACAHGAAFGWDMAAIQDRSRLTCA